jgi:hypothetical protein
VNRSYYDPADLTVTDEGACQQWLNNFADDSEYEFDLYERPSPFVTVTGGHHARTPVPTPQPGSTLPPGPGCGMPFWRRARGQHASRLTTEKDQPSVDPQEYSTLTTLTLTVNERMIIARSLTIASAMMEALDDYACSIEATRLAARVTPEGFEL